jgi:hypothetical protein
MEDIMKDKTRRSVYKNVLLYMFLCCFFLYMSAGVLFGETSQITIPDVPGWTVTCTKTRILTSATEEQGRMTERIYKKNDGFEVVKVLLLQGPGTKWLSFPRKDAGGGDGPVGTGATYRTIEILGKEGVLEHHPVLGYSLAIRLENEKTLTFETSASKTTLMAFSKQLLRSIID